MAFLGVLAVILASWLLLQGGFRFCCWWHCRSDLMVRLAKDPTVRNVAITYIDDLAEGFVRPEDLWESL